MIPEETIQLPSTPGPEVEQEPPAVAELEPEAPVSRETLPITDAHPESTIRAQPPPTIPTPKVPEPVEVVLDVAFQVLDVLTTPNPP